MTSKTDPTTTSNVPAVPETEGSGILAVFGENPWAGIDDGLDGFVDDVGVSVPRMKFDPRLGGGFIDELTGEKADTMRFIWLASFQTRAYWKDPFGSGDQEPTCRATTPLPGESWKPDEDVPDQQSPLCSSCPKGQWIAGEPPECHLRVNVLAFDTVGKQFVRTSFGGTALKHVRKYISALKASAPPRPPLSVVTEVSLTECEGKGMRWFEPTFGVAANLEPHEVQPLLALREQLRSQWQQLAREDETNENTRVDDNEVVDGEIVYDESTEPF